MKLSKKRARCILDIEEGLEPTEKRPFWPSYKDGLITIELTEKGKAFADFVRRTSE